MAMGEIENIAVIWDDKEGRWKEKPFEDKNLNIAYSVFSKIAEQKGKRLLITSFESLDDHLEYAYAYENNEWVKKKDEGFDAVIDKFKLDQETENLKKKLSQEYPVVNNYEVERICKDKYLTAQKFPELMPETLNPTEDNVEKLIKSYGRAVLKPRSDLGGRGIEIIQHVSEAENIGEKNYLAQGFVDTTQGIEKMDFEGVHDLRIIGVNGEPVLSFVRTQEEGLISNVAQGGKINFVELEDIPEKAFEMYEQVEKGFEGYKPRLIALDIAFDTEGDPWLLEINTKPGLKFYGDEETKRRKSVLMNRIIDSFQ